MSNVWDLRFVQLTHDRNKTCFKISPLLTLSSRSLLTNATSLLLVVERSPLFFSCIAQKEEVDDFCVYVCARTRVSVRERERRGGKTEDNEKILGPFSLRQFCLILMCFPLK